MQQNSNINVPKTYSSTYSPTFSSIKKTQTDCSTDYVFKYTLKAQTQTTQLTESTLSCDESYESIKMDLTEYNR